MPTASRTKKSIHNSLVACLYYVITLFLNFFSRKIFLEYLGTEILGLNTTAANILQFLNLAELGIGSAVGFSLFKPLHEKDYESINEIVSLQGFLYKKIGIFILLGAIVLMFFFPFIFKKISLPLWYTYASFGVLLFSALLGYFVNYKQILLSANQQDYKIQYSYRTVILIKVIFQMFSVYYFEDGYIWWLFYEIIFAILGSISLHYATLKEFPNLRKTKKKYKELKDKYSFLVIKIKQLFFHKIGGFALSQSSPLIIYAFIDLKEVALYGNYVLITNGVQMLMVAMFKSIEAGVGDLVAEGNNKRIKNTFEELFSIRFILIATLCITTYFFTEAFVKLWIGREYLLPNFTLLLLVVLLFIFLQRLTVDAFINAYGLFSDIYAPIVEVALNLSLSIIGGNFWGLNGIIGGVVISQIIIILIWKPYFLFHNKLIGYYPRYLYLFFSHIIIALVLGVLFFIFFKSQISYAGTNILDFIKNSLLISSAYFIVLSVIFIFLFPKIKFSLQRIIK